MKMRMQEIVVETLTNQLRDVVTSTVTDSGSAPDLTCRVSQSFECFSQTLERWHRLRVVSVCIQTRGWSELQTMAVASSSASSLPCLSRLRLRPSAVWRAAHSRSEPTKYMCLHGPWSQYSVQDLLSGSVCGIHCERRHFALDGGARLSEAGLQLDTLDP